KAFRLEVMGWVLRIDRSIAAGADYSIRRIKSRDDFTKHVGLVHSHARHDRHAVAQLCDKAQLPTAKHRSQCPQRLSGRSIPEAVDDEVPANIEGRQSTNETEVIVRQSIPLIAESICSGAS